MMRGITARLNKIEKSPRFRAAEIKEKTKIHIISIVFGDDEEEAIANYESEKGEIGANDWVIFSVSPKKDISSQHRN